MKKTSAFTFSCITLLILTFMFLLGSAAALTSTLTLTSESKQLPIMLPQGTTFNGSILTTGTIRFWVNAPSGAQIVNLGLIDSTKSFSFVAQQTGNYSLNFENDLSNTIKITLSYTTNPDISNSNNSVEEPFIYFLIPIVIVVLGCIVIILLVRPKKSRLQIQPSQSKVQYLEN